MKRIANRVVRAAALAGAALLLVALPAAIAASTSPPAVAVSPAAGPDGTYTVTYEVTQNIYFTSPDGDISEEPPETGTVTITCTAGECVLGSTINPWLPLLRNGFATLGGPTEQVVGAGESLCKTPLQATVAIDASKTAFNATLERGTLGWEDCGSGPTYLHALEVVWVGGAATGDLCLFEPSGCGAAPTEQAGPGDSSQGAGEPTRTALRDGDPAAPSVLSALPTPSEAGVDPLQLLTAAALTVILALLMSFPTSLLNNAIEEGADRLSAWRDKRRGTREAQPREWTRSWWWAALGILAAALISAFVDPDFGTSAASWRVLLSIAIAFALDIALGWVVLIWLTRRVLPKAAPEFSFRPSTLLLVAGAVLLTRLTGFEPGIVFGLVAGVSFAALSGAAQKARAVLVSYAWAFGLAIAAWIVYGFISPLAGGSFAGTLLVESLSSLVVGGIVALPLGLIPLRGLGGYTVWSWNRKVWAACYAIGLLAFFIVLMPMPFSWAGIGWDLAAWIGAYAVYAVIAVALWLAIARPWVKEAAVPAQAQSASTHSEPSA